MPVFDCQQNTPAWDALRLERITASRIVDVLDYLKKGGEGAGRVKYRWELVAERMTGQAQENGAAFAARVRWGVEHESTARELFGIRYGFIPERVGFITHPTMDYAGGSPDALADADGVVELKCPESITHLKWIHGGIVPEDHQDQCMWNIACSEREYCYFGSYDPRQKDDNLRLFAKKLYRDDKRIAEIESEVARFNESIEAVIYRLRNPHTLNEALAASLLDA